MSAEDNFLRLQEGYCDTELERLVKEGYFSVDELFVLKVDGQISDEVLKSCLEILEYTNYG